MGGKTDCNDLEKKDASLESEAAECTEIKKILPLYRALVEQASEAILVARMNDIVFANPRAEDLFERSEQELIGHTLEPFIHIEDRPLLLKKYAAAIESDGRIQVPPIRIVNLSGDVKWVNSNISRFSGHPEPIVFFFNSMGRLTPIA